MYDLNVLIFDINKTAEDEEQVKTLNNLLSLFGGKAEIKIHSIETSLYYPTMKKSSKNGKQEMQAAQAIIIIFPLKKSGK